MDESFNTAVEQWVDGNTWKGYEPQNFQSILLFSRISLHEESFKFKSGFSYFRIEGTFDGSQHALLDTTISFMVPVFGAVTLYKVHHVPLDGSPIHINVADKIVGVLRFTKDGKEVKMNWELSTPFSGEMSDHASVFPLSLTNATTIDPKRYANLPVINESELAALRSMSAQDDQHFMAAQASEHQLLESFLNDFATDDLIVIPAAPVGDSFDASTERTVNISFAKIFQLQGSLDVPNLEIKAALYVTIPFAGRIKLTSINGSLKNQGVTVKLNAIVAKGIVTLSVEGGYLYVDLALEVKLIGMIKTGRIRLWKF